MPKKKYKNLELRSEKPNLDEMKMENIYTKDALEDLIDKKKLDSQRQKSYLGPNAFGYYNKYKY